jgi:hypothetical protein
MNFLIAILKKATKGDNFRPTASPFKYNDNIAQLNAVNPDQYNKINVNTFAKVQKTKSTPTQSTSGNSVLPGAK